MTREEAIDILRSYLMFDKSNMQIDMALNMAIEALSNYITESPNDVVESQNDVIKKPRTVRYKLHKPIEYVSIEFDEEETITHIDHCTAYEERKEPLPQYEEWQDEFNKMCESAKPTTFVADEWYRDTFKGGEE